MDQLQARQGVRTTVAMLADAEGAHLLIDFVHIAFSAAHG